MSFELRNKVNTIINKVSELRTNGITDPFELEMYFIDNMIEYYDLYPHLIKRLCREENQDNSYLYKMLNGLEQVSKGQTSMTEVETPLSYELANKFLYPVLDKANLEKSKK